MNWKSIIWTAIAVLVGLVAYDMFVKKALKIEGTFDPEYFDDFDEVEYQDDDSPYHSRDYRYMFAS